tara:strand:- start:77 stop:322 length:246 start_codon:yes stop_codon:yes gene_type:complete
MSNKSVPDYKNTSESDWSVRGRESKVGLITQLTFRYPDNQGRNAKNLNLAWNAKNTTKIITAVEALNELVKQNKFISKKSR